MDLIILLKMFYQDRDQYDPMVQMRAPVDIFDLFKYIDELEKEIRWLRGELKFAGREERAEHDKT